MTSLIPLAWCTCSGREEQPALGLLESTGPQLRGVGSLLTPRMAPLLLLKDDALGCSCQTAQAK